MRTGIVLLLSFAAIACAQDRKAGERKNDEKKRLSSVTWDLKSHKLTWDVQHGSTVNGQFVATSSDHYEISPDDAIMAVSEEKRGFTQAEAASLHKLLDTLSLYCAESVVWWDQGQGIKLDEKNQPKDKNNKDPNRQKVDRPEPEKPSPIQRTDVVALNMVFSAEPQPQDDIHLAATRK